MSNLFKICSMNVRGLAGEEKRKDGFNWLKQKNYQIYCLQDVHVSSKNKTAFIRNWDGEVYLSSVSSGSRGVAILFNGKLDYKVLSEEKDISSNFLMLEIELGKINLLLAVIYGPNQDSPDFYNNLKNKMWAQNNFSAIVCGDWNLVLDYKNDTHGYVRENNVKASNEVLGMMQNLDLIDTWRAQNPAAKKFTWVSGKKPIKMARLDFFLVSPDIHAKAVANKISYGYRSDHSLVSLEIEWTEVTRGKGFWKFNSSLLVDPEYVNLVKQVIEAVKEQFREHHSSQTILEMIKLKLRGVTIPYCARKKRLTLEAEKNN